MTNREPWRVSTKNGIDSMQTRSTQGSAKSNDQSGPNGSSGITLHLLMSEAVAAASASQAVRSVTTVWESVSRRSF